jgi:hypothetical protein
LSFVNPAQNEQRENCARECHRHIRLCIPDVALSAEKILGRIPGDHADGPFEELYRALNPKHSEITNRLSQPRPVTAERRSKFPAR